MAQNLSKTILAGGLLLAVMLSGCAAEAEEPRLEVRQTLKDSLLLLSVDAVSKDFRYDQLLIMVDNEPWKLGAKMDGGEQLYEVEGKDRKGDRIMMGDTIRIPITGTRSIELRHMDSGKSLQQLELTIDDLSAPPAPVLQSPVKSAALVDRQAVFRWQAVQDASDIHYELEYWIQGGSASAPAEKISSLAATSFAVPKSNELAPATTYGWHVRAIDDAGNIGEWSETWEFSTKI